MSVYAINIVSFMLIRQLAGFEAGLVRGQARCWLSEPRTERVFERSKRRGAAGRLLRCASCAARLC